MPFTGSHPAAVLPLIRLGLIPSALVIGSMVADLPYFLPTGINSASTHSAIGILGVDLLLGLLSFAIWHALIGPLAVALAPSPLRARLPPVRSAAEPRPAPLLLVVSLLAGAATHVLWDEFTHVGRFGYRHLAWLAADHGALPGYRWAQYGSGVVGALLILLAVQRWWRSAAVLDPPPESALAPRTVKAVVLFVVLAVLGGAVTGFAWVVLHDQGVRRALFLIATWGGGAGLVAALAAAVTFRARSPRHQT